MPEDSNFELFKNLSEFETASKLLPEEKEEDVDLVRLCGMRKTPTIIAIDRESERDPNRDAKLLEAYLSSSLDPHTWQQFCMIVYSNHIMPILQAGSKTENIPQKPSVKKSSSK